MMDNLFLNRYKIFFFSQIAVLFGSLLFPSIFINDLVSTILFQINLLAGILLLSKKKKLMWFSISVLIITTVILTSNIIKNENGLMFNFIKMSAYFLFYALVTVELIKQVWKSSVVNGNVIIGLISGYISVGLLGFFICISIEMISPGSFLGFTEGGTLTENAMYYSYITLLTIGYGDLLPVSSAAKNAAILIGLTGQIYLVVITAIVIGKYIGQAKIVNKDQ
ncbi:ion channel [Lutibacter holmesii]|uniref:Ion channel n=2 Tax=Lutibacter holmesii TaxID=1137985 RepID=A0ABW3WJZ5_9FLAO